MLAAVFAHGAMGLAWTNPAFVEWRLGLDASKPALEEVLLSAQLPWSSQHTTLVSLFFSVATWLGI